MPLVVFLKGVNVGGNKSFRPSVLASRLAKYGVTSVGAAGTFVVAKPISRAQLRSEFRRHLPFEAELMICEAKEILDLASADPFAGEVAGPEIVRFIGVLAEGPRLLPALPLSLPPGQAWLVKIIAVRGRFALGLYRRTMQTIALFGKLEKHLGGSLTNRNWNTMMTLLAKLSEKRIASPTTKSLRASLPDKDKPCKR
ncbi:hypothetical protein SBV1_140029 [Verrucomicrobia bacterium]|nr:hypothetical protein SBV1_140029 [Verrucomicrobiota bacterium]